MTLVTNLDLMRIEPNLFTDAGGSGMLLTSAGDASVTGHQLTSATSDFVGIGVSTLDVAVVAGEPVEILAVNSATSLEISRRRSDDITPPLDPAPGTGLALSVISFDLLSKRHEDWVLEALAILPVHPTNPITAGQIVNLSQIKQLIALRVVMQGFARSAALDPASEPLQAMAAFYASLVDEATRRTTAQLDLDGDGLADHVRRFDSSVLART